MHYRNERHALNEVKGGEYYMLTLKQKLSSGLATGLFLAMVTSTGAFADVTVDITGNGRNSDNDVTLNAGQNHSVSQTNVSHVVNVVDVTNNTGNNTANDNVGSGDVNVKSGNATANVTVKNHGNENIALVNPCGCDMGDLDIIVAGNGRDSDNTVTVNKKNKSTATQTNVSNVLNAVSVKNKTGKNKANDNVGAGMVDVKSGNANATIKLKTHGGSNVLLGGI